MLEARQVTKTYGQGVRATAAVQGISLRIGPGEFVAIIGPSGSGKSTLLHLLGALDTPDSGEILYANCSVQDQSDRARALLRREHFGFIFQQFNLIPSLTAAMNVAMPLLLAGQPPGRALERARLALDRIQMTARSTHLPAELSGGEMQRVAIARALVNDPKIVLCDEPTGSLDSGHAAQILRLLRELPQTGRSVVLVTHDAEAAQQADRIICLKDGRIEAEKDTRGRNALVA